MKKVKKKSFKTYIIYNDVHFPYEDKQSLSCLYQTIYVLRDKIDGVVANGDIIDWGTFSRHDIYQPPKCFYTDEDFLKKSSVEYAAAENHLDMIDYLVPKAEKFWLFSNHDDWLFSFIEKSPASREQLFGYETRLHLSKRGWKKYRYNDFLRLGKLRITHGIYAGSNHAKKHVDSVGKSVLYGHLHDIQVYSKVTPEKDTHMAWCNGCLCNLNPDYMRNRPQNWSHGFAIVYLWPNGDFQVDIKRINNGRVVVDGKLIEGELKYLKKDSFL